MIIRDLPLDTLVDVAIMHTNTQRRLCMGIPHGGNQAQAKVKFIDLSAKKQWNYVVHLNVHMY